MQIRFNTDVTLSNEDGTTNTLLKGWSIVDVVSVSACPKDPNLRSVQIEYGTGPGPDGQPGVTYQYLILPKDAFSIEEAPGWQAYARREEERGKERKAA
jgi:hypothetical protein